MTTTRRIQDIQGWGLEARDGIIGTCDDFLFGDDDWVVRYIVVNTGKLLPGRKVLVSPISVTGFNEKNKRLELDLTKQQIEEAPPLETNAPVSRRYEMLFNQHFAWRNYWAGTSSWGLHPTPRLLHQPDEMIAPDQKIQPADVNRLPEDETHLRSASEVIGYHIHATDEDIGHIEDFLLDQDSWAIAYFVIDTSNWRPGSKWVVIAPGWIESIDWNQKQATTTVSASQIRNAPEFDPVNPIDQVYEKILFNYYGKPYSR